MQISKALIIVAAAVAVTASATRSAPISFVRADVLASQSEQDPATLSTEAWRQVAPSPDLDSATSTDLAAHSPETAEYIEELQARGNAGLFEGVSSALASTSTGEKVSWRVFFRDPDFKPEVRNTQSFKDAFDTIQRSMDGGGFLGRSGVRKLSPEEHDRYTKAQRLLYNLANAAALRGQFKLRYIRQKQLTHTAANEPTPRPWVEDLPEDTIRRLGPHADRKRLVLKQLLPDEKRKVTKKRQKANYDRNKVTKSQQQNDYNHKTKRARSTRSNHSVTTASANPTSAEKNAFKALTEDRTSIPTRDSTEQGHVTHSSIANDSLGATLGSSSPSQLARPGATRQPEANPVLEQGSLPPTLKRMRLFDLNELPDLDR